MNLPHVDYGAFWRQLCTGTPRIAREAVGAPSRARFAGVPPAAAGTAWLWLVRAPRRRSRRRSAHPDHCVIAADAVRANRSAAGSVQHAPRRRATRRRARGAAAIVVRRGVDPGAVRRRSAPNFGGVARPGEVRSWPTSKIANGRTAMAPWPRPILQPRRWRPKWPCGAT